MFSRDPRRELFARAFVPLTEPKWQRRPCTWPAVDALGNDVAYLTCEFAFARVPPAVAGLQVEGATSEEVLLSWRPPPHDRVAPVHRYHVEALPLLRGNEPAARTPSWQRVAEVDADPDPHVTASGLRPNTRYRFRVHASNEAGVSPVAEVEAATGPSAPGLCGRPRLAGCKGPVLTIEWDGPEDDGGTEVVAYRLWVAPGIGARVPEQDAWFEVGHVRHDRAGPQRAEIHTEDLDHSISRYFCRVAAIGEAGEVGAATPETAALPFPNPCSICGPNLGQAVPAIADYQAARLLGPAGAAPPWDGGAGAMAILETGPPGRSFPLAPGGAGAGAHERAPPQGAVGLGMPEVRSFHGAGSAQVPVGLPPDLCETVSLGVAGSPDLPTVNRGRSGPPEEAGGLQVWEQHSVTRQLLAEKREMLESSLARYRQVGGQLSGAPGDQVLVQSHMEAEIEAAGLQAEVAVLDKQLGELDAQLSALGDAPAGPVGWPDLAQPDLWSSSRPSEAGCP